MAGLRCGACLFCYFSRIRGKQACLDAISTSDQQSCLRLPVDMTAPSFYEVLGVAATCSADDVRRAYHQAARKYHPDKRANDVRPGGSSALEAEALGLQQFLRIQEAYETLRSEELRRQYDTKLQQDALVRKREQEAVVVSDEVPLGDMQREVLAGGGGEADDEVLYTHQCRCGDLYEIYEDELQDGVDVVPCTGCSLYILVLQ